MLMGNNLFTKRGSNQIYKQCIHKIEIKLLSRHEIFATQNTPLSPSTFVYHSNSKTT